MFKPVAVIPVYDHAETIGGMVERVIAAGLPAIVVDDGSGAECARAMDALVAGAGGEVTLVRRPENGGKGAAVLDGLRRASALGFTHALQIDADGQHDAADIPRFLAVARDHPGAVILGRPVFDASVPKVRLYGRGITHVLVWVHTLSFGIPDAMCGFRIYPLGEVLALAARAPLGRRMDFDIDILVRLSWQGMEFVSLPTKVRYPLDGISHFRLGRDNVLIAWLHVRSFVGMLVRLPRLIGRRRSVA